MNNLSFIKLFVNVFSRPLFYPLFQLLLKLSLYGMNRGPAGILNLESSGELDALKYVKSKLKNHNIILFDVGANVGDYTDLLIELFQNIDFHIYSFEPALEAYKILSDKFKQDSRVKTYNIGFGSTEQKLNLYQPWDCATGASLSKEAVSLTAGQQFTLSSQEVSIRNFSNFCQEENITYIDFLKIDVEGYELEILQGALPFLEKNIVNFIQLELGPTAIPNHVFFKDYWNILNKDFYVYIILGNGLHKIDAYSVDLEIFRCTNFLFERKNLDKPR